MADIAELGIKVDSKNVQTASKDLTGFAKASQTATATADKLGKVIGAVAATLAVGVFTNWIRGAADAADEATKTAAKVGVTIEALTGLQYAGDLAGVSAGQMGNALKLLGKNSATAAAGGKTAAAAFESIGVSVKDASGKIKSADTLLLEIADAFQNSADGAGKVSVAMQLMGRAGADMIPFLNSGSEGIRELTDQARALGLVMDQETASAAEEFNDNLTVMGKVSDGVANKLLAGLAPAMADVTGTMVDVVIQTDAVNVAADALGAALKVLASIAIGVGAAFTATGQRIGAVVAALSQAASGDFSGAMDTLKQSTTDTAETMTGAFNRIKGMWDGTAAKTAEKSSAVVKSLKTIEVANKGTAESTKAVTSAQDKMTDSINRQIESLQIEAATVAMTKTEATLFKMALDGATQSQLEAARAALSATDAYKAQEDQIKATADAEKEKKAIGDAIRRESMSDMEVLAQKQQGYYDAMKSGAVTQDEYNKASAKNSEAMIKLGEDADGATTALDDFMKTAQENIQSQLADTLKTGFDGSFDDIKNSWGEMLKSMIAEGAAAELTSIVFGAFGKGGAAGGAAGGGGMDWAGMASSFMGMFDSGGFLGGGKWGIAGENGPEIVKGPAQITSTKDTARMGGGQTIIINQPNVTNSREAERSSGAARRAVFGAVNRGARYA